MDVSSSIPVESPDDLDAWFRRRPPEATQVVVSILKQSTGRATVSLGDLQEVALCHGWVDTLTQRIDDERYGIRFVPRRPGSTWGASNREMARRLLAAGRITPGGLAVLPPDLLD